MMLLGLLSLSFGAVFAQTEKPPAPAAPRETKIPLIVEKRLPTGLRVATVERKNVPLVTVQFLLNDGANVEAKEKAGLANLTASMLTKGTKTKSASQIAEAMEFLGGSINAAAGWNNSFVTITVMSDKLDAAMAILADVVLNPSFKQDELDLLKSQTLDGLTYNLKQPGFLANYVASTYSLGEHPAGGTPDSLKGLTRADVVDFHKKNYYPMFSTLIFSGDVTPARAGTLAQKYFGRWNKTLSSMVGDSTYVPQPADGSKIINRLLVVDLPDSGQASVNYVRRLEALYRRDKTVYFPASVLNSVLGGGYSSRLNQEIRIKRGLSYGAGSVFLWHSAQSNFSTRTQTKNESAAEVAQLVEEEIKRLIKDDVKADELGPRKLVLNGDFGRDLETTAGIADRVAELYTFGLSTTELNDFIPGVNAVTATQIKKFAGDYLKGGDMIIVGDYKIFKDDLAKRFPNMKIEVVKAADWK